MTDLVERFATGIAGFVVTWVLGGAFLFDNPFEEIAGFKE